MQDAGVAVEGLVEFYIDAQQHEYSLQFDVECRLPVYGDFQLLGQQGRMTRRKIFFRICRLEAELCQLCGCLFPHVVPQIADAVNPARSFGYGYRRRQRRLGQIRMVGILRRFVKNVKVYIIRTAVYHSGFRYSIVVWVVGIDDALFHDTERELQRYGPRLGYGR